jgi:DNA repair protein RadD
VKLREYQEKAVASVIAAHESGAKSVLLVAPTGAGKTVMSVRLVAHAIARGDRVLFVVHRRELVLNAVHRMKAADHHVGAVMPGAPVDRDAPIQVTSVQSLVTWSEREAVDFAYVVVDEAHHYADNEWSAMIGRIGAARMVGLTATPERADGSPLGDLFEKLVVAATYTELLDQGHIVPCAVVRPENQTSDGAEIAQDPLAAYLEWTPGTSAMVFVRRVAEGEDLCRRFIEAGVSAVMIHADMPLRKRDAALSRLRSGKLTVAINVFTLTEGVDVPCVRTIVLARSCDHVSTYLQIVGRALRPFDGKRYSTLIDLTGASYRHGMPTDDRNYALSGRGMSGGNPRAGENSAPDVAREWKETRVSGAELVCVWPKEKREAASLRIKDAMAAHGNGDTEAVARILDSVLAELDAVCGVADGASDAT